MLSCAQICPTVCVHLCYGAAIELLSQIICSYVLLVHLKHFFWCVLNTAFSLFQYARIHLTKLKNLGMLVSFYQLRFTSKTRYEITYFSFKKKKIMWKNHVFKDLQLNS